MFDDRLRAALRRITTPLPLLALGSWTQVLAFAQVLPVNPSPPAASHQELRVRGRVVDALGGAVAAADVWLADEDGREIGRTRCDGLGVFFIVRGLISMYRAKRERDHGQTSPDV